jgi:hypothetical protein
LGDGGMVRLFLGSGSVVFSTNGCLGTDDMRHHLRQDGLFWVVLGCGGVSFVPSHFPYVKNLVNIRFEDVDHLAWGCTLP